MIVSREDVMGRNLGSGKPVSRRAAAGSQPLPLVVAVCTAFCMPSFAEEVEEAQERRLPRVDVIGTAAEAGKSPGSAHVIHANTLEESRVFNVNEALRKIPGVHVRDEEGVGLRPNIGIRGQNPTRSTKTLLLEDGLPLSFAPYGDNASYYHPPIDRYDSIEVSKGSQIIRFGPQTAGGVVNYLTPMPQQERGGFVGLSAGSRGYLNGHVMVTGNGAMADFYHKESDGARANMHSRLDDVNFKWVGRLNDEQQLTLRASHFREYSQLTYAGLTQAEYNADPRQNAFKHDYFDANRTGLSATHEWRLNADQRVLTSFYGSYFDRDWWRQASTSTDCASRTLSSCRVDGRLRNYTTVGTDSRIFQKHTSFGLQNELEYGIKLQSEIQKRRQERYANYANFVNDVRDSTIFVQENQDRRTQAMSAFASNRLQISEQLAITPILRVENIRHERNFFATASAAPNPSSATASLTELVPGIGATYQIDASSMLYGGVHRGFSPPRVEDTLISSNGAATSVDLNAERSINAELGLRASPTANLFFDAAVFRNDFSNLVQVGSIAGGSTAYSEGKALFQGFELAGQADKLSAAVDGNLFGRVALTWLPTAEQKSSFSSPATNATVVNYAGKRLPYAPESLLTLTLGYRAPQFWNARLEYVYVGEQYASFDNLAAPSADGQKGLIDAYGVWNAVFNYTVGPATFFVAGKNLGDTTYIVDRTRGIQVGMPRTFQAGLKYAF